MIDRKHVLLIARQAELVGISRDNLYCLAHATSEAYQRLMKRIDALNLAHPFMSSRMLRNMRKREGFEVARRHVATLIQRLGIEESSLACPTLNINEACAIAMCAISTPRKASTYARHTVGAAIVAGGETPGSGFRVASIFGSVEFLVGATMPSTTGFIPSPPGRGLG